MPKNTMADLRNHLFETIEALKDDEKPMELDRAKAVCQVAEKLIDTAKVEVQFMEVTGESVESDFFDDRREKINRLRLAAGSRS